MVVERLGEGDRRRIDHSNPVDGREARLKGGYSGVVGEHRVRGAKVVDGTMEERDGEEMDGGVERDGRVEEAGI